MNTLFRAIAGTAAAVVLVAPAAASATASTAPDAARASASAKRFTVVQTFQRAKLDVCKVSVNSGAAWRVYARLDTRKVHTGKHSGSLYVYHKGTANPTDSWRSAMTRKGTFSKVGSVRLPRKSGYSLDGGIGATNMGNGGPIKISNVGRC